MDPFKICGMCRKSWRRWQDMLLDPGIRLLGLQAVPRIPDANLLVFEHACGTTVAVLATSLRHLLAEPEEGEGLPLLYGSAECQGHCRRLEDLDACQKPCRNARDRRLTILVRDILVAGCLPPQLSER